MEALAPAWDDLVRAHGLPFISGALWMRSFWDAFGDGNQALKILAAYENGRLVAIVPLRRTGRMLRIWSPVSNFHTPYVAFACVRPPSRAGEAILDGFLESSEVLDLGPVQPGAAVCAGLMEAARSRRLPAVESAVGDEAIIDLRGPWEAFRRSLSQNLENATARHQRQLQRLGKLVFEEIDGGDRLSPVLEECFGLEAEGWKADHGSPILSREDTLRFYTELARRAAAAGALAVYTLRLDGRLIAFEYCLRAGARIDMLKISYAPDLARYSPGNVLRYLVLKTEIERGDVTSYHMGTASEWKLRWANRVDPLVRVRIYGRGVCPRLAYWGARLRAILQRCEPLRIAVRSARNLADRMSRSEQRSSRVHGPIKPRPPSGMKTWLQTSLPDPLMRTLKRLGGRLPDEKGHEQVPEQ
jgi:CelD/BcsL family acetyltransferase involved in cellulose biosynthesis